MTEREALDRAIEMRQQVINGGTLFCDPATGKSRSSVHDIVNRIDDFATVSRLLEKKEYNCKFHVESVTEKNKKRIPLTKEDLDARFVSGKTMRFVKDKDLCEFTRWHYDYAGYFCVSGSKNVGGGSVYSGFIHCKFIDGDPCYKEVEE